MSADNRMLRAALAYPERFGFAVFPCRPHGKPPLTEHGCNDATKDPAVISGHWRVSPSANVGIATGKASGIIVLDVDPRHDGDDTLAALEAENGRLPDAPTVLTGGGGLHVYFKYPPGADRIANSAGTLGPGLDIRADGGYVIAPPSVHENGNEYRWEIASRIDQMEPPELPAWLLAMFSKPVSQQTTPRFETPSVIEAGARNDALFRLARSLHARKMTLNEILPSLCAVNEARCKPPLDLAEVEKIARNAVTEANRADFKANERPGAASNVWIQAVAAPRFIAQADGKLDMLVHRLVAPGSISLVSGTRGLGKTNVGLVLAVASATGGEFLGETLKPSRVLYLNRDNPTATIRKRLRSWGAERADNLFILGRDKAPPLAAKDVWQQFPLNSFDLVIVDSLSAFLEAIDEKDGGASGEAVASVLDAAAKSQAAFLILANTKRSGRAFRGSGVVADRADIHFEARDATDLKLEPRREHWSDCLPDPSDEAWGERAKRRAARPDYRVAFICSKFRDGDEPEPFIVEICHDNERGWSAREVTAEVEAEHERLKQAVDARRRELVEKAIEALQAALPVAKNPDAIEILKTAGLGRDAARKIIDEHKGQHWIIVGNGTKADPQVLLQPETARRNGMERNSRGEKGFEQPIPAAAEAEGPQESMFKKRTAPATPDSCDSCGSFQSVVSDKGSGKPPHDDADGERF